MQVYAVLVDVTFLQRLLGYYARTHARAHAQVHRRMHTCMRMHTCTHLHVHASFFECFLGYYCQNDFAWMHVLRSRYALSPIIVALVLFLPWLWARLHYSSATARATFKHFMSLVLFGMHACS